ncbi:MAG: DNA polymerase III subunit chi [Alphaproteobacteria bacterium]
MSQMLFYQLGPQPLDQVLATLLQKTLERGLRAVVRLGEPERLAALDSYLWTYSDGSFLPHGTAPGADAARQPILLTTGQDNPGMAQICFLVHGSRPDNCTDYERVVYMFDGRNEAEKQVAREHWKAARDAFDEVTFWQQTERGGWEKQG